jgi:hypothetical protein
MSNTPKADSETPAVPSQPKAQWETPVLQRAGHLGDVLKDTSKTGLSEHDPGIVTYKPHGQDH